ncbi:unnamed protein product [Clavelina lepadiformis]|uniref:Gypsy retrotransposon integrase-like protein 1 n=1 Tax=Clavelina lepadiformis TaxID=159417 RepID=A0ABP0G393_CLALP
MIKVHSDYFLHGFKQKFYNAINGSRIVIKGNEPLKVSLNLNRTFLWHFEMSSDIAYSIIGSDFLIHFGLNIDLTAKRLTLPRAKNDVTDFTTPKRPFSASCCQETKPSSISQAAEADMTSDGLLADLTKTYPNVFDVSAYSERPINNAVHHIITTGEPIRCRPYRMSPEKEKILKQELNKLLELGVIERSNSPFSSPVMLIQKKDAGQYRIVNNYKILNQQTQFDTYNLPLISNFPNAMAGSKFFSVLDLLKGFHQIRIADQDIPKTAFTTSSGTYQYVRLPMGLCNSSQTFQRCIDNVLRGLSDYTFNYIDDVIVFSSTPEEHKKHLETVLQRFQEHNIIVNKRKCVFNATEVKFLGFTVNKDGASPIKSKVDAVEKYPLPVTIKELRRFLGMVNFYRRFLPNAAGIQDPLNKLLGTGSGRRRVIWTPIARQAFQETKQALCEATQLAFPVHDAEVRLSVDASDVSCAGVLEQVIDGCPQPLAFFSKSFTKAQRKYSVYDRELLGLYLSIKYFRYFLDGRQFRLFTDHKALVTGIHSKLDNATAQQFRYLSYIAQFCPVIEHISGESNIVSDALSRITVAGINYDLPSIDYLQMASHQHTDRTLDAILHGESSLQLKRVTLPDHGVSILCDMSTKQARPVVPASFRKQIFDTIHSLSHAGIKVTQKLIAERFVWPKMMVEIRDMCKTCIPCQQTKVRRHTVAPLKTFKKPDERFSHVHVDIVGPLTVSNGYSYLLTVIDRYTRYPVAIPLKDITAKTCADAFILNWVANFGVPKIITSDRGRQFTSQLWHEMAKFMGTKLIHTTSHHPQSDGMLERAHRTLKTALKAYSCNHNWYSHLGWVMLGIRASVKEDIECAPSQLVFGTSIRLPGEFFETPSLDIIPQSKYVEQLTQFMATLRYVPPHEPYPIKTFVDPELKTCSHVFIRHDGVRTGMQRPYSGPYTVIDRQEKFFTIDLNSRIDNISINRLKAGHIPVPNSAESFLTNTSSQNNSCNDDENLILQSDLPFSVAEEEIDSHPVSQNINTDEEPVPQYTTRTGRVITKPARFR